MSEGQGGCSLYVALGEVVLECCLEVLGRCTWGSDCRELEELPQEDAYHRYCHLSQHTCLTQSNSDFGYSCKASGYMLRRDLHLG